MLRVSFQVVDLYEVVRGRGAACPSQVAKLQVVEAEEGSEEEKDADVSTEGPTEGKDEAAGVCARASVFSLCFPLLLSS